MASKNKAKIQIDLNVVIKNAEKATGALDKIAQSINDISGGSGKLGEVGKKLEGLSKGAKGATGFLKKLSSGAETKQMAAGLAKAAKQLGVLKAGAGGAAGAVGGLGAALAPILPILVIVAALLAALAAAFIVVKVAITAFKVALKAARAILEVWKNQIQEIKGALTELRQALGRGVDGLRQFTQGLLSVGRAITFFVSIPLTAFIKEAAEAAIEFQQQMSRVQKVMGATADDLAPVRDYIKDIALVSNVSIDTLSKFAEQLAQLGVTNLDRMKEMITVFEVFSVAADISSDSIAFSMGKVARAFGQDLNTQDASAFMLGLASTLNRLENIASVTASSLLITMSDIGSEADILAIPPHVIATWATLAQEQNMSANEAGTAIKRLITGMVEYQDTILETTSSLGLWADKEEYLSSLNEDFEGTVIELATALAGMDSGVDQVGIAYEALEKRGGSALVKLVKSIADASGETSRYAEVLEEARKAFVDYTSLLEEFEIMQENTAASISKVKNSLEVLSITIGNHVLPAVQNFLNIVGPGIKALAEAFAGLDSKTKNWILGIIAFIAVAGPAAFFINQVAFGFVMAAQGLAKMVAIIPAALKFIFLLVKGMLTLNPAALLVGSALFGIFKLLTSSTGDVIKTIVQLFQGLAKKFGDWGKGIFDAFASGIESSGTRIRNALLRIIDIFQAFFQSFSPPKEGPLSQIDVWGENLFNTYLQGFENADFGILDNVGRKVEGILTALNFTPDSDNQDLSRKNVVTQMLSFREGFAQLLSDFRKFGEVSESAIDKLVSGLGNASDEVKELIQVTLRYEKLLIRIREIEQSKKDVQKQYKAQEQAITSSQMTAEEMVEALGNEQWIRDQSLSTLEEEKKLLEEQAEAEKQKLEWQNNFMDALQDQADLMMELLETLEDMAGAMGELADSLGELGKGGIQDFELPDIGDFMAEMDERVADFKKSINKIKAFALGAFLTITAFAKVMWLTITGASEEEKQQALAAFDEIKGKVEEITGIPMPDESILDKLLPEDIAAMEELFDLDTGGFIAGLATAGGEIAAGLSELFTGIKTDIGPLAKEVWDTLFGVGPDPQQSNPGMSDMSTLPGGASSEFDDHPLVKMAGFINEFGTALATHGPTIMTHLLTIGGQIWEFVGSLLGITGVEGLDTTLGGIATVLGNIAENETVPTILEKVWKALEFVWNFGKKVFGAMLGLYLAVSLVLHPFKLLEAIGYGIALIFMGLGYAVVWAIDKLLGLVGLGEILDGGLVSMEEGMQGLVTKIQNVGLEAGGLDEVFGETFTEPLPVDGPIGDLNSLVTESETALDGWGNNLTEMNTKTAEFSGEMSTELVTAATNVGTFQEETSGYWEDATSDVEDYASSFSTLPERLQTAADELAKISIPAPKFQTVAEPWWARFVVGGEFVMPSGIPDSTPENIPGLQAGGFRSGPGPTWVGEGGKELMTLPPGGHITSHGLSSLILNDLNSSFAGAGGGDTVNINVNNPVVREDSDIDKIADAVSSRIAKKTRNRNRFGG